MLLRKAGDAGLKIRGSKTLCEQSLQPNRRKLETLRSPYYPEKRKKMTHLDIFFGKCVLAHLVASLIGKEIHNLCTMITLELDHLPHVLILNDGAIASCDDQGNTRSALLLSQNNQGVRSMPCPDDMQDRRAEPRIERKRWGGGMVTIFFFKSFQKSLRTVFFRQPLNSRQRLATVAL